MPKLTQEELDNYLVSQSQDGNVDLVKLALDKGANVHARIDLPLRRAVQYDQIKVAKLLLKHGANANTMGLLDDAIVNNDLRMVRLLIDHGAIVNDIINVPNLSRKDPNIVKLLIKHRPALQQVEERLMEKKYRFSDNPGISNFINGFIWAIQDKRFREANGYYNAAKKSLKSYTVEKMINDSAKHMVSFEDLDNDMIKYLLSKGANPDIFATKLMRKYEFKENPRPIYTFNYDQDTFILYLSIAKKKYAYYNISPFKFDKFRKLLRRNFGKAMAYLRKTQG